MPCRQTYEVNKRELNKAAQRDQSYKNCLVALLIFFFLCIILIVGCVLVPWKSRSRGRVYNNEYDKYESEHHHGERGSTTTTSTENTVTSRKNENSNVSSKKNKDPNTHEDYGDRRTVQKETTVSIGKTFTTDNKDHSTKKDSKYNDGKQQWETTTSIEKIFTTDNKDHSTKKDSKYNDGKQRWETTTSIEKIFTTDNKDHSTKKDSKYNDGKQRWETTTSIEKIFTTDNKDHSMKKDSKYNDGKQRWETTTSTGSTFNANDKDSTEVDPKFNEQKEVKPTTTDEDTLVTWRQTTDVETTSTTSPSEPITIDMSSFNEYNSSEINMTTHNIVTSTSPSESITTNMFSSDEYNSLEINPTTHNIATSTLPSELIATDMSSSDEYNSPEINMTAHNTATSTLSSPLSSSDTTNEYSSDEYFSSEKSIFDMSTDNIATSPDLGDETTVSTSKNIMSKINVATDSVTFSTLPTQLDDLEENSTDSEISKVDVEILTMNSSIESKENTSARYSFDDHSQESQSVASIVNDIIKTTIPATTLFDSEKDEYTEHSTGKQEDKSTTAKHDEILNNNDDVTRGSSLVANYDLSSSKDFSTTTEITNNPEEVTDVTMSARSQNKTVERYDMTSVATEQSSMYNYASYASTTSGTVIASSVSNAAAMASPLPDEEKIVCETENCKRIASKMLSYMNHLADPCDDFYEYACGGFEANPQLIDGNLVRQTKNYQRIAKQMIKEKRENVEKRSTFATYYDSCVQYERTVNFNERVEMAISALKDIGKFYINDTWSNNYTNFTNLFVKLILHHSALLFDVVPKFDEQHPTKFTLQISPPKYESPFMTGYIDDLCLEDEFETEQQYVNLMDLYASYKKCNKNTEEFLRSIKEALTVFSVFKGLNDNNLALDLQSQYIEKTVHDIDSIIMQGYFSHFPSKDEMQEVYVMNTYSKISLEGLEGNNMLINWTQLIRSLIGADIMEAMHKNDLHVYIYLYKELMDGLSGLEKFAEKDPMSLNNVIMALYAHKLYHELVLSRRNDVKDHCLRVATNLLRLEASNLYILSFSDQEIKKMNELIQNSFNDLKQTLRNKTEEIWANKNGLDNLLEKIDNLNLSLPDFSYYKDRDSFYSDYNMPQIVLDDNYFNNSMILMKRHRILTYAVLRKQINQKRQIWTHYATPFQSKAGVIYGLNIVIIPYGIMDWSLIKEEHTLPHILLATLGNLIAHQIAHHFDHNGLKFLESSQNIAYEEYINDMNLEDYTNCHSNNLYHTLINFTLPFTGQTVSFSIPRLTLNERLSDIVGFRLAYDTLVLTKSKAQKLPWIKLSKEQLFYLAYTQMYCTKSPLTSSYVSLYESEDLPNRIRMFVAVSNNKFVAEEWNCPMGLQITPNAVCSMFPYIDNPESTLAPA